MPACRGLPEPSLLLPLGFRHDAADVARRRGVPAFQPGRREQNLLLNVRRQEEQVHDLRDARPACVTQSRDLGLVLDLASTDELVKVVRQSEEPGEARRTDRFHRLRSARKRRAARGRVSSGSILPPRSQPTVGLSSTVGRKSENRT